MNRRAVVALALLAVCGAATRAAGQDTTDQDEKPKTKRGAHVRFLVEPHPSIRLGDIFHINFRARFSEIADGTEAQSGDPGDLDIEKRRLGVEGELFNKAIAFQLSREMGGQKTLTVSEFPDLGEDTVGADTTPTDVTTVSTKFTINPWREAWVGYQQFTFASAKYGLFKLPFSIEEQTGAEHLDFAYRSLAASTLAPGRDQGWMVHGQIANHLFGYEYGVFEHDGHNAHVGYTNPLRVTGGETTAWRVTSEPFRNVDSIWTDLYIGYMATSSPLEPGESSIKGKTVAGFEFYNSKFYIDGDRKRNGFELRFRPGPFALQSEYIRVTEQRLHASVYDTDLAPLLTTGWYVSGTWAITGEIKANGLNEPRRPLLRGGIGAIEIAARVERISFGDENDTADDPGSRSPRADYVVRNSDDVLTYGVNWYPNRWFKLQFNLIREDVADPTLLPNHLLGPSPFWSRVVRFQVGF